MLDGIRAIQARVAQLQSMTGALAPARTVPMPTTARPEFSAPSFSASLADAQAPAATATALKAAIKQSPGAYGSMQVPAELQRYGNGKIPESALQSIGVGDFRLSSDAAASFRKMKAD